MKDVIFNAKELNDGKHVFVFGSNLKGLHAGGAAKSAAEQWGAEMGVGEGITGNAYALPTMDENLQPLPIKIIREKVDEFIKVAENMPDKRFLVTAVGCGIAGYDPNDIAPLFITAPKNCFLPLSWLPYMSPWNTTEKINISLKAELNEFANGKEDSDGWAALAKAIVRAIEGKDVDAKCKDAFSIPDRANEEQANLCRLIKDWCQRKDLTKTGGCKAFYTPDDWRDRGNVYGRDSVLIIAHDGGDLAHVCNMDYEQYQLMEDFAQFLNIHGYYIESCTSWYSAIYCK